MLCFVFQTCPLQTASALGALQELKIWSSCTRPQFVASSSADSPRREGSSAAHESRKTGNPSTKFLCPCSCCRGASCRVRFVRAIRTCNQTKRTVQTQLQRSGGSVFCFIFVILTTRKIKVVMTVLASLALWASKCA